MLEWDVLSSEAYDESMLTDASMSLLYSPNSVQMVEASSSEYGINGYFYLNFDGFTTEKIHMTSTSEFVANALRKLPTVGDIAVSKSESRHNYGYAWTITFLNSNFWNGFGHGYYEFPELKISGQDYSLSETFASSVVGSATTTFSGINAVVNARTLVSSMNGFEEQEISVTASVGILEGYFYLSLTALIRRHYFLIAVLVI